MRLFAALPEHIREAADLTQGYIALGQGQERQRSCHPPVGLAPLPGGWVALGVGLGRPRESWTTVQLAGQFCPAVLADFAVRISGALGHRWVRSVVLSPNGELDVDSSWLLGLAENQLATPMPGGIGVRTVLKVEDGKFRYRHQSVTGRLEIEAEPGFCPVTGREVVKFHLVVRRPAGAAFTVAGAYRAGRVENEEFSAGNEPAEERHFGAAARLLEALEPQGDAEVNGEQAWAEEIRLALVNP